MEKVIRFLLDKACSLWSKICIDGETAIEFVGKGFEWFFFLVLVYINYDIMRQVNVWWTPDYATIGDYLNVKLPQILIGLGGLCGIVWAFDLLTPGSWIRKTSEDPHASAAVLCALILGAAHILAR